jgi:hypothetical protein
VSIRPAASSSTDPVFIPLHFLYRGNQASPSTYSLTVLPPARLAL